MNKWTTQEMAQRLARDIEPGWYVNIGIGKIGRQNLILYR